VNYRESYDLFATSGILFDHEGERQDQRENHVATGDAQSVRELMQVAFDHVGLDHQRYCG
jgi:GDP-D-mannose dehydratase